MRLTNSMMTNRVLADIQSSYARMSDTSSSISSGKKITKPSDDPLAAAQLRARRSEIEGIDRFKATADNATQWLSSSDNSLSHVSDTLQRARELTVQASTGTLSAADRNRIADEIDQLASSIKDSLGTKDGDAYLFSGTDTTTVPYTTATGDTPQAGNGAVVRDIGPGVSIQLNVQVRTVDGSTAPLTASAIAGDGTDGKALAALRTLSTHLRAGDQASIGTTDLQALDANLAVVSDARSAVGATQNRVDAALDRLEDLNTTADGLRSDLEDTDYAEALTKLTAQQTAFQAALKSGAQIIQPSLLDFLR